MCQGRYVEFTITVSEPGTSPAATRVVACAGELDAHASSALAQALAPLTSVPQCRVVVDLSQVSFMDSTGLSALVTALKHVREADGSLDVVVAAPRVLKVLQLTGLDVVIPLHDTLDAALAGD